MRPTIPVDPSSFSIEPHRAGNTLISPIQFEECFISYIVLGQLKLKSITNSLYKAFLPQILGRSCPVRIPRSGEAGKNINCFSVYIEDAEKKPILWVLGFDGMQFHGKKWSGNSFATDATLVASDIEPSFLKIIHYYGLSEVRYHGIYDFARNWFLRIPYIKIGIAQFIGGTDQYFFNRTKFVAVQRNELLRILLDKHIEGGGPVSPIDLMTDIYTLKWVLHPQADMQQKRLELYLDSLSQSGELAKTGHRFAVAGRTIDTLERFEEEERRHVENVKVQRGMFWLTVAIVILTLVQTGIIKLPVLIDLSSAAAR